MPSISFLGTRFENLRIAGVPVEIEWDQEIFASTPANDLPYALDPGIVSRVGRQYDRILQNKNLSPKLQEHYNHLSGTLGAAETIECSLVNRAAGLFPGTIAGNTITVPGFGTITLGKVTVKHEDPTGKTHKKTTVTLTMIDLKPGLRNRGECADRDGRIQRGFKTLAKIFPIVARWTMDSSFDLAGIRKWFGGISPGFRSRFTSSVWALLPLLLIFIQDTHPGGAQAAYDHAWKLFQHGRLADSQKEAEKGYIYFLVSEPEWATRFLLLEAEALVWRGMYHDALGILDKCVPDSINSEEAIRKLALEGVIYSHQRKFLLADQRLTQAAILCKRSYFLSCGDVLQARGNLTVRQEHLVVARKLFFDTYAFAHLHQNRFLEASASLSLGWDAIQVGHFDEAVEWSNAAYRMTTDLGAEDLAQSSLGNLGWAYYQLGDGERALETISRSGEEVPQDSEIPAANSNGSIMPVLSIMT